MENAIKTGANGDAYERRMGRWSRLAGGAFVDWLGLPHGLRWLDVGCGTGALTEVILARCAPNRAVGIEPSAGSVAYAAEQVTDDRADFHQGYAEDLPFSAGDFDVAVSGLVINFVADKPRALAEMIRVVRPGGCVAGFVWDFADRMQMFRHFWDAATPLDPAAAELDHGRRFPVCKPGPLADLFANSGLSEVEIRLIDVPTNFQNFEDYWSPFLAGQGTLPDYCNSLSEVQRIALRERIRASLPIRADGSIHLVSRAWTVCGIAPR